MKAALYILPVAAIVAGLAGFGLMFRRSKASATTGRLPASLSTDPAQARTQLVNALGKPTQESAGKTATSGRSYDIAFWEPGTTPGLPGALLVTGKTPSPVLYAMTFDRQNGKLVILASQLPDETAKTDIAKIEHSI